MVCCCNKWWHVKNKFPQLALRLLKTQGEVLLGPLPVSFGVNPGTNAWHQEVCWEERLQQYELLQHPLFQRLFQEATANQRVYSFKGGQAWLADVRNQKMFEVGKDLWPSSCPSPLLKQGQLEQAAQDYVQMTFEYLQECRLHNLPDQSVPGFRHPYCKKVFCDIQKEPPVFQLVPIASALFTEHYWILLLYIIPLDTCRH